MSKYHLSETATELLLCDTFQLSDDVRSRIIQIFSKSKIYLGENTTEEEYIHFLSGKPDYELLIQLIGKRKAKSIAINQVFLNGKRLNDKNNIQNGDARIIGLMN